MANQLTEYRQRHKIESICPDNEGLLFFECGDLTPIICLTSSHLKCVTPCQVCIAHQDLISIELFHGDIFPQSLVRLVHAHIAPDGDVLSFVTQEKYCGKNQYIPYKSKGERDQERWLWNFFLRSKPFHRVPAWSNLLKQQKKHNAETKWIEQVSWAQQNCDGVFQTFYQNVYSVCMIGRKYLLLD